MRFTIIVLLLLGAGCSTERSPTTLVEKLREASSIELYSLDPTLLKSEPVVAPDVDPQAETEPLFHDWTVLGSTVISDKEASGALLDALQAGIDENDGIAAACFTPRHAIRAQHEGTTYDVILCFDCLQARLYVDDERQDGFLVMGSPQPIFDDALQSAGIALAPPAPTRSSVERALNSRD
ncbi:hypothetical protein [Allorhodopirellula heiligendammensis]|uniref:Uncharacterized protein n=1 Tax=Allorhodopirellula heiligendammensis TaxID=2714739 RepID=A0A5C6BFL4_9BACT|nr:hypothetical protein [Allorhodopirellula heiligendammensis]TWU10482.1 hypothetical protein Poly21_43860 [Allorhodopirellula heiligendammensis]|tara:strand:- start:108 stop:650 length:543 start_codon:yes stop_codon:yes gene_type:complete